MVLLIRIFTFELKNRRLKAVLSSVKLRTTVLGAAAAAGVVKITFDNTFTRFSTPLYHGQ